VFNSVVKIQQKRIPKVVDRGTARCYNNTYKLAGNGAY
jgi:hypothetical protein